MSVAGTATTEAKPDKVILGVETTNETEKAALQPTVSGTKISVHQLVNQLIKSLQSLAGKRSNLLLNDIPRKLSVSVDENMLAYVLWHLMNSAMSSTENECIHIEAVLTDDRTLIRIKDLGTYFYHTISHQYRQVQYIAEKLGGNINLNNDENYGPNVSFSIPNNLLAAA